MKFVVYRDQIYIIKIFALILLPPQFQGWTILGNYD